MDPEEVGFGVNVNDVNKSRVKMSMERLVALMCNHFILSCVLF